MLNNSNPYKRYYEQFSQNVNFAARTWHHHVYLFNRAAEDEEILAALNKAPRFWFDLRYSFFQATIIFLGKIFDLNGNSFGVDRTIRSAYEDKDYFSKKALRERKGEFEGIDEYIENASELTEQDIKIIQKEIKKAKTIWQNIKPLRDKVYAHSETLSDEERASLYKAVKNEDINRIIQILLNVSNALWEAEFNGRRPDFSQDHTKPIEWAHKNIDELISSLFPENS